MRRVFFTLILIGINNIFREKREAENVSRVGTKATEMKKILLLSILLALFAGLAEGQTRKRDDNKKPKPKPRPQREIHTTVSMENEENGDNEQEEREEKPPQTKPENTTEAFNRKLMFLNAVNFDFTGKVDVSYVGHVNIFAPSTRKKYPCGFNVGMMKLNYGIIDTLHEQVRYENVIKNPLQNLDSGSTYLRQANKYKTVTGSTAWSLYAQPNLIIYGTRDPDSNYIYLHAHFELLVSKWTASTTITNLSTDTMVYHNDISQDSFVRRSALQNTNSVTKLDGYFGLGLTFALRPWRKSMFFFQPTLGITSDYPKVMNNYVPVILDPGKNRGWRGFYLVRAYFTQAMNENTQIVLGADIRGLFPRYDPLYAAYVGANLSVGGILSFLGLSSGGDDKAKDKKDKKNEG